jgi:hypothetical protein
MFVIKNSFWFAANRGQIIKPARGVSRKRCDFPFRFAVAKPRQLPYQFLRQWSLPFRVCGKTA